MGAAERAFWQPNEIARHVTFWKSHLDDLLTLEVRSCLLAYFKLLISKCLSNGIHGGVSRGKPLLPETGGKLGRGLTPKANSAMREIAALLFMRLSFLRTQ